MQKNIKELEEVETFALRMATKSWGSGNQDLLSMSEVTPLEVRRAQSSSCTLFKIINGLCLFPPDVITTRPNNSRRTNNQHLLKQPLARTNAYLNSFVLRTVHQWMYST